MEAWEHISCLVGWILSWSILLLMFFEICKQIFCYRVAMVILYSYKYDYYKILLWKPRDCLGDIPLCFRQQTPRDSFYPWTNKICLEHWGFPFGRCESQRYKWTSLLWWMVNQLSDPISPNVPKPFSVSWSSTKVDKRFTGLYCLNRTVEFKRKGFLLSVSWVQIHFFLGTGCKVWINIFPHMLWPVCVYFNPMGI